MGLTQVSTDGVKNDAITKTKIPANQIEASELADNAVDTNAIADQAVALSKLPHGDGSSDGKFLRANNGADPSFETITGTTINNNAATRIITGSGTANTLNAESNLTLATDGKLTVNRVHASATTGNHPALHIETDANGTAGATFSTGIDFFIGGVHKKRLAITNTDSSAGTGDYVFYRDTGSNEGIRILAGGGLTFNGDTAAANALDDYEEGTWTPSSNTGTVNSYITGSYTKVGRMVYLTIGLYQFSDTSSSNAIIIGGVPFAAVGTSIGNCWLRRTTTGDKNYNATIGESGASLISIQHDSNGNNMGGNLVHSDFAHSTPYINISITYQTS